MKSPKLGLVLIVTMMAVLFLVNLGFSADNGRHFWQGLRSYENMTKARYDSLYSSFGDLKKSDSDELSRKLQEMKQDGNTIYDYQKIAVGYCLLIDLLLSDISVEMIKSDPQFSFFDSRELSLFVGAWFAYIDLCFKMGERAEAIHSYEIAKIVQNIMMKRIKEKNDRNLK